MKHKTQTVTLCTAEIIGESSKNTFNLLMRESPAMNVKLEYTVKTGGERYTVFSKNQKFKKGDRACVIIKDGKCELCFDSIFNNLSPFILNNPIAKLVFFDREEITELPDLPLYILKKGLHGEKRRRKRLKAQGAAGDALVIGRNSYGEWQVGLRSFVKFTLTLLVKGENGYFLTTFSDWDKDGYGGRILKHTFDLSVGEIIPVLYSPENPADITVDYENLKPFSFDYIPHIPMPEE